MKGVCVLTVVAVVWGCCFGVGDARHCLEGDFDKQLKQVFSTYMMTPAELKNLTAVFHDFEKTLQKKWRGAKVIPLGSAITGMAMKWSDTDCMVDVPYYNIYNATANRYLVVETVRLLKRQPKLYEHAEPNFRKKKIDLLKFTYVPTQRGCDVSFITWGAWANSKMTRRYYKLDERGFKLALIIKIWSKLHRRTAESELTSYTLTLLIIFYLQQAKIVPPYYILKKTPEYRDRHYREHNKHKSGKRLNMYELVGGFFEYYSDFDFEHYVVSPFIGHPLNKKDFHHIDDLPKQFNLYKKYIKKHKDQAFDLSLHMSVQDVFMPHINTVKHSTDPVSFIAHIKFAARAFKSVPKKKFLTTILGHDVYEKAAELNNVKRKHCN